MRWEKSTTSRSARGTLFGFSTKCVGGHAIQDNLDTFEQDKEQVDDRYFELATGMRAHKDTIQVPDSKVKGPGRIKPADTIKPSCGTLKLTPSEFHTWAAKGKGVGAAVKFHGR